VIAKVSWDYHKGAKELRFLVWKSYGVVSDSWFADLLSRMLVDGRLVKLCCYD
jgi:hypothetical protein